jgi:HD-like signal output (HDOD) protein
MASPGPLPETPPSAPLEAVLRRLAGSSGFPTLSTTISDINRVVSSDSHSAQQLTQVILRDVSLTTMLLHVVNSATYGQFGGSIRTVSKAVLILGTEAVRDAAMTLMMLAFSKGRPQEKSLQDELIGAFFAGVLAKSLCRRLGMPNNEEAVICAMCQSLGRLLVIFFLYEESQRVQSLVESGMPEEAAAVKVLGISYRELGVGVARYWNFPGKLVEGMQVLAPREMTAPTSDVGRLKLAANLANDLYLTALRCPQSDRPGALQALSKRYNAAVKLEPKELIEALQEGLREIAERSTTLDLPARNSPVLNIVRSWAGAPPLVEDSSTVVADPKDPAEPDPLTATIPALPENDVASGPRQVLSAGIRDITETLTTDFQLDDVLRMALETMYRSMGFSHTMIFLRDPASRSMRARFGFGAEIERIVPQCHFPLERAPDVFHVVLEKGVDLVIENTQAESVAQRIPQWYRRVLSAQSFLLLPLVLKAQTVGLLYADSERAEGIKINADQLDLLRTLRTQVVLAFKQTAAPSRR